MTTYYINNLQDINTSKYRTRLLGQVEASIDETLRSFLNVMPKTYFETNDEDTVLQHLSAILIANTSGKQEQIVLRAGNSGTYNHDNKELVLIPNSDPNNLSWKTRNLYFENTPLGEVAELVSRVYHTELVVVNPELASCPITVTFSDQSLESVLSVLEITLDLEITRNGSRIMLDGTGCIE